MNVDKRRQIAAWVLLAVFLPMLILSSVHVHESDGLHADECHECVHHHCHGHLGELTTTMHACVLCQFLTLSFITTGLLAVVYYKKVNRIHFAQLQSDIHFEEYGIPQLRAPPFV
jgi:hypothetical protein